MSAQPDMDDLTAQRDREALNQARIQASEDQWKRAGQILYKLHATGVRSIDPADVITQAEHDCDHCADCIHDGHKCCGCYDGACCKEKR